jgi:DNA polymerase (family 10)
MLVVPGIGPKTALKYYAEGIKNFDELVVAAHAGKLKDKVRDAVLFAVKKERVPHDEAKILAQEVIFQLRNQGMIPMLAMKQYEVCGSIRRNSVDSKDVDIVGCVADKKNVDAILDEFVKLGTKISRGENRASIRFTHDGRMMQVDLWLVPPESYGSALVYATGSKDHNIELRKVAIRKNMVLNEYGIFRLANGEVAEKLGGSNEQDVYRVLSLGYQEPWERNETLSVLDTK